MLLNQTDNPIDNPRRTNAEIDLKNAAMGDNVNTSGPAKDLVLFFGCRGKSLDLYFASEFSNITRINAFSREKDTVREYVQGKGSAIIGSYKGHLNPLVPTAPLVARLALLTSIAGVPEEVATNG